MRKITLLLLLFSIVFAQAQISNLANLATGQMEMFTPIYEKDNAIYGYFSLFKQDKLSENEEKYEYVILDKNLNKVANGEFIDSSYKGIFSRYYSPEKVGGNLLLTKRYGNMSGTIVFTSSRLLDLKVNEIGEPFYIEDNNLLKGYRDIKSIKKTQRAKKFFNIPIGGRDGYVVIEAAKGSSKENATSIEYYNLENQKLWDYTFGDDAKKSEYNIVSIEEEAIYFTYTTKDYRKSNIQFLQIDSKTGKKNFSYLLEGNGSKYSYSYTVKKIRERTILTGKISPYSFVGYNKDRALGMFKIVLDDQGNELFKKHFLWEEANEFIEMNKKGKLDQGYKLFAHSYFVFNDERIAVLSEKFKIANNILLGPHVKTESFILMEFDVDFNLTSANTIEKDMSKFSTSDFLFAQYLNDEKDAVFFYRDYQKDSETREKNWVLGIVSLVDGAINHEIIPMSSDDFYIHPYIAKEGYILLREFNDNSEFDSIRLERLNLN